MFTDWPYSNLSDFLIALSLIKLQITRIARVEHHALRGFVDGAPLMQRCEQLLAKVTTLKLRVDPQQW